MIIKVSLNKHLQNFRLPKSKNLTFYDLAKFLAYGLIYFFVAVIIILSAASIIYVFQNPNTDNSNVTYYFFAAVAILANACFSWSRSLPGGDIDVRKIVEIGEVSFLAALIFLFASLFKYANLHIGNIEELLSFHFHHNLKYIFTFTVSLLYIFSYALAIILVIYACIKITRIVIRRNIIHFDTVKEGKKRK